MKDRNRWRFILLAAILGVMAEAWWVEEQVFFLFYDPDIYPMSEWGTRLEAILFTPVEMLIHLWWVTVPLLSLIALSVVKLHRLKRRNEDIRTSPCTVRAGAARP